MGIDVSGVFQRQESGRWSYIGNYHDGRRGTLRSWLGYSPGGWRGRLSHIAPLRGLPVDFDLNEPIYLRPDRTTTVETYLGTTRRSWLLADEILAALPALAIRTLAVPLHVYYETREMTSDLEQWKAATGLCQEPDSWKLVSVTYRTEDMSHLSAEVSVDCFCDFSAEVAYFTDEVRRLRNVHGDVRFVYGFE